MSIFTHRPYGAGVPIADLTRYRKKLVEDRAKETQRIQKVLEDAGIKLDSVVTDVMGKASRRMLEDDPRSWGNTGESRT